MKTVFNFLQHIWTASIRRQLMLGIILVHAVLMSIFVYDLVERQRSFLKEQSIAQTNSLAKTLAVNSLSWVLANDFIGLEELVQAQMSYPAMRYAMVLSPQGRVLGHTDLEKVGLYITDSASEKLLKSKKEQILLINNNNSIDVASPITSNGVFVGWARVSLTQEDILNNLQIITRDGILYTLFAILIGALFAYFMAKGITQGLKQVVDVAEGINSGDQSLRVNISRSDEIGQLGNDFNLMLDSLSKSKRDFQAVMDNSSAVIYAKDIEGRYLFINKKWMQMFNMEKEEIVGKTDHSIFTKEFADKFRKNDLDVLNAGYPMESEEHAPLEDGVHTYITAKFPLFDEQGKIYAVCGISTDITDRVAIEKEKAALESQLFHSQKMQSIGQLTGGVAHDFNNLLAIILGYTELSKSKFGEDNEDLNDYLNEIETAGIRGRELIKQMMLYSRKDQSQNDVELIKIDKIVEETASMLKGSFPSGIVIKTLINKNIPYINASVSLISQVIMNLCINAKDGMGQEGELEISLGIESFKKDICHACHEAYSGDYLVLTVKDNGSGMPEEMISCIFEPFFTSKRVGEGTGMGLSVVHGVVHKLGGHIMVESLVNKGTVFKILLPFTTKKVQVEATKYIENLEYDFSGLNIMVVDDEPSVTALLEASLEQTKANIIGFTDSEEALAYFAENSSKIDIIITDQTMPKLTGVELSKEILALRSDVKIILCTGHSADVTEKSALQLGIKSFVFKPVKIVDLKKIINELK